MKILFIVTDYYSANGICAKEVMNCLASHGHEVHCLSNCRDLSFSNSSSIFYHYVKPRFYYRVINSIKPDNIFKKVFLLFIRFLNSLKMLLMYPFLPLISPRYVRRVFQTAKSICTNSNVDVIIPVYSTIDTVIAATNLKKENGKLLLVPYFLDSLSGGFPSRILGEKRTMKRGFSFEDKLLPFADLIIMMKSSKAHYEKYASNKTYYTKIVFLDLPLFDAKTGLNEGRNKKDDALTITFVGSMPTFRSPKFFVSIFKRIKDDNIRLLFVGDSRYDAFLKKSSIEDNRIVVIEKVDHDTALEYVSKSTFLLNLGNTIANMTPSKIFEYISSCKPIISTAPIKNEPSIPYLNIYPFSLILYETDSLERNVEKLSSFISEMQTAIIKPETFKNFFYLNSPEAFYNALFEKGIVS